MTKQNKLIRILKTLGKIVKKVLGRHVQIMIFQI